MAATPHDLLPQHERLIQNSAITPEVAQARGYWSATTRVEVEALGFTGKQARVPALVVPIHGVTGEVVLHQLRPDRPRLNAKGKALKYETAAKSRLVLDVPPGARGQLRDPAVPLWITEGARKADAAVSAGLCSVALLGVWGWRGTNAAGGKTALADWDSIALNGREVFLGFDSDVVDKASVQKALAGLAHFLELRAAKVHVVRLPTGPGGAKVGLDDYLAAGHSVDELRACARTEPAPLAPRIVVTEEHHLTDLGNAQRLVAEHGQDLRYCPAWRAWLIWDGRRWIRDGQLEVDRRAKATIWRLHREAIDLTDPERRNVLVKHALRSEQSARLGGMVTLAQSEPGIPVLREELDPHPWLLNVLNGTVDLRTGQLRPHCRDDLLTRLAPINYDPEARSEVWEKFLRDATGGDAAFAAFLQRAAGYSLTGDTSEEVLFFVYGPEATGKTTYIEALKATLGDYATTADFEAFLARPQVGAVRNDIARLAGARLVASVEVDEGKKLAQGLVKQLTGGDTVTARFLYQEQFEFQATFKLWLAANHAPKVSHHDGALWRRILRVPFEQTIAKERRDPQVKAYLSDPARGGPSVLAWAVRGCLAWQREGLGVPGAVTNSTEAYRAEMDPLKEFLADRALLDPSAWAKASELWAAYIAWAREAGEHPVSRLEYADSLRARGCSEDRKKNVGRLWRGVGLAGDAVTHGDAGFRKVPDLSLMKGSSVDPRYPMSPRHREPVSDDYQPGEPTAPCQACRQANWWFQRSSRRYVCVTCHPPVAAAGGR